MTIAAHSLGGYISTRYALYYPNRVKKLILLSPFAVESTTEEHKHNFIEETRLKTFAERWEYKFKLAITSRKMSFFSWMRYVGKWVGGRFYKTFLKSGIDRLPEDQ